jgi:hypothetical protein
MPIRPGVLTLRRGTPQRPLSSGINIVLALVLLWGCVPASAVKVPSSDEAKRLSDPSESQVFKVPRSEAVKGVQQALRANGFVIDRENRNFILAKESVWSRGWRDDVAAIYVFEENPATTRINIIVHRAPGILMPQSHAASGAAHALEARQIRLRLFNAIRSAIVENQRATVW